MIILRQKWFANRDKRRLNEIVKTDKDAARKAGQTEKTGDALARHDSAKEGYTHTQRERAIRDYKKNNPF